MSDSPIEDRLAVKFGEIMDLLGLNLKDPSLIETPKRVAKMYCREIFAGLDKTTYPKIMVQPNNFNYNQMLIQKGIEVNSVCEHHFVPILGKCAIAYIPNKKVIGLSKLNRIARWHASRPQVQERLTQQILDDLVEKLETDNVAVCIDASHLCVKMRGVQDANAETRTSALSGSFKTNISTREEFYSYL